MRCSVSNDIVLEGDSLTVEYNTPYTYLITFVYEEHSIKTEIFVSYLYFSGFPMRVQNTERSLFIFVCALNNYNDAFLLSTFFNVQKYERHIRAT